MYSLFSQLANSLGNVMLTFVVARHASQAGYGAWALGYAAFMMAIAVARAVAGTPLLLHRHASDDEIRAQGGGSVGIATIVGVVGSLALLGAALLATSARSGLWPFALVLPILLAQDAVRYVAFTRQRPTHAALMDSSWLLLQACAFVLLELTQQADATSITIAWGLCAAPSLLWQVVRGRLHIRPSAVVIFWQSARANALKLLADAAVATGVAQALPVVVAVAAGLAAAGALRGGLTLIGLVNILVAGLTPMATLAARHEHDTMGSTRRFLIRWTMLLGLASLAFGGLIFLIPDHLGRQLLGVSWLAASALLLPLVLQSMVRGPYTGVPIALRATDRVGDALRLRLWTTIPSLAFPWGGALIAGANGAAWGIFASAVAANALSIRMTRLI